MKRPKIVMPCFGCKSDVRATNGVVYHQGWKAIPEWTIGGTKSVTTRDGLQLDVRIATKEDIPKLLASPEVFPKQQPGYPDVAPILSEYTDFRNLSYPYICVGLIDDNVVGRLYVERNPANVVLKEMRNQRIAILDSAIVAPSLRKRGIVDKLMEFAESIAIANGIHWLEIGAQRFYKEVQVEDSLEATTGLESLSGSLRRGYHQFPLYMNKYMEVHYLISGLQSTIISRRYKNGIVMYKNLRDIAAEKLYKIKEEREHFCSWLIEGIPRA